MMQTGSKGEPRSAQEHRDRLRALEVQVDQAHGRYRAAIHRRLAELYEDWFLDGVGALHHFQESFKLDRNPKTLVRARRIYRELGRLGSVEKLIRMELSVLDDPAERAPLLRELGELLMDLGRRSDAARAFAQAVSAGEPAGFLLEDAQVAEQEWLVRVGRLLQQAEASGDPAEKTETLLRAAGIAGAFSEADALELQRRAYQADPFHERAAALVEGTYVESDRTDALVALQRSVLAGVGRDEWGPRDLEFRLGKRWALRHNHRHAVPLLLAALRSDVDRRPAVTYLYQVSRTDSSLVEMLVALAEELGDRFSRGLSSGPKAGAGLSYLLASAALVAARDLNNIVRARSLGERLSRVDPSHPALGQLVDRSRVTGD